MTDHDRVRRVRADVYAEARKDGWARPVATAMADECAWEYGNDPYRALRLAHTAEPGSLRYLLRIGPC